MSSKAFIGSYLVVLPAARPANPRRRSGESVRGTLNWWRPDSTVPRDLCAARNSRENRVQAAHSERVHRASLLEFPAGVAGCIAQILRARLRVQIGARALAGPPARHGSAHGPLRHGDQQRDHQQQRTIQVRLQDRQAVDPERNPPHRTE